MQILQCVLKFHAVMYSSRLRIQIPNAFPKQHLQDQHDRLLRYVLERKDVKVLVIS